MPNYSNTIFLMMLASSVVIGSTFAMHTFLYWNPSVNTAELVAVYRNYMHLIRYTCSDMNTIQDLFNLIL